MKYALMAIAAAAYVAWLVWEILTAPEGPDDGKMTRVPEEKPGGKAV